MSEEFNGWANRESWAMATHLNNDQRLQIAGQELVKKFGAEGIEKWIMTSVEDFLIGGEPAAEWLRLMVHDVGSFWRVEWEDVAESLRT